MAEKPEKRAAEPTPGQWNDWKWQLKNRLKTAGDFRKIIKLTPGEEAAFEHCAAGFPAAVTPYFARLIEKNDPGGPIRRQVIPLPEESVRSRFDPPAVQCSAIRCANCSWKATWLRDPFCKWKLSRRLEKRPTTRGRR